MCHRVSMGRELEVSLENVCHTVSMEREISSELEKRVD